MAVERFPVAGTFTISRGAKTFVDVVVCTVGDGSATGRGEATAIYYHGESAEGCARAIADHCAALAGAPLTREGLHAAMPRGAARNALDCALWDLEAKRSGVPVWRLAGLAEPKPLMSAFTISVSDPAQMERDARKAVARGFALLKCKLTGTGDGDRIAAVRQGAPEARLIVDANESWADADLMAETRQLAALGVEMIEQPIRHGEEARLKGIQPILPFCADESCQDSADLPRLADFPAINIKLDKAGGLTEALSLAHLAREQGKRLMLGCMLSTSLGIAPAFLLAQQAEWVDLDGALLLERDRAGGLELIDGLLHPGTLWGMPR
ncbi:MAG: dipeptide epimerase [Sphingobium sp. 32-64-5]|nr:MAG: dipeptide epimerase [Sphingobium sp. 32-64-5]